MILLKRLCYHFLSSKFKISKNNTKLEKFLYLGLNEQKFENANLTVKNLIESQHAYFPGLIKNTRGSTYFPGKRTSTSYPLCNDILFHRSYESPSAKDIMISLKESDIEGDE